MIVANFFAELFTFVELSYICNDFNDPFDPSIGHFVQALH